MANDIRGGLNYISFSDQQDLHLPDELDVRWCEEGRLHQSTDVRNSLCHLLYSKSFLTFSSAIGWCIISLMDSVTSTTLIMPNSQIQRPGKNAATHWSSGGSQSFIMPSRHWLAFYCWTKPAIFPPGLEEQVVRPIFTMIFLKIQSSQSKLKSSTFYSSENISVVLLDISSFDLRAISTNMVFIIHYLSPWFCSLTRWINGLLDALCCLFTTSQTWRWYLAEATE